MSGRAERGASEAAGRNDGFGDVVKPFARVRVGPVSEKEMYYRNKLGFQLTKSGRNHEARPK